MMTNKKAVEQDEESEGKELAARHYELEPSSTMEIAPHCSQKLHIVRWPLFAPEAHATFSFGI